MTKYEFNEIERNILESLGTPMAIYQCLDKKVVTLLVTDGLCKLMGADRQTVIELLDNDMYRDTHPDDKARVADAALKFASGGDSMDCVYRSLNHITNQYAMIHSHGEHFFTHSGVMLSSTTYAVVGFGEDGEDPLSEKLASNYMDMLVKESLIRDNFYDSLTGLPNMSYFLSLADAAKKSFLAEGKTPAIAYIDLNGMKMFNERYGLHEGDNLIMSVSHILRKYFPVERCGRMGSDHFAVFLPYEGLEEVINNIFEDMENANEGRTLTMRVGVYSNAFEDVSASRGCDRAKIACDKEKGIYASKLLVYDEQLHNESTLYEYVINNFERALKERWITPYYQPIVRSVNGMVCDEEALARWIDPNIGLLPPDMFIGQLEKVKLIHELDIYILERVLEDMEENKRAGRDLIPVSINLSRYDFELCDIVEEIYTRVNSSTITPDLITIEITESVSLLDPDYINTQIAKLHNYGFKVWMDDFGSGYSSLNILQKYDFDTLKFDMRFMREFTESKKSHLILRELVQMAVKLDIDTLVEGVETIEQVKFLREIGVNKMQGYYWGKPNPVEVRNSILDAKIGQALEKPVESTYYDAISKANLTEPIISGEFDINQEEFFGPIPMGVLEFDGDDIYILRYNKSYAMYLMNTDFADRDKLGTGYIKAKRRPEPNFINTVMRCIESDKWEFLRGSDELGYVSDVLVKCISYNPVSKVHAVELVIISLNSKS